MTVEVPDFARIDPPRRRVKKRWGRYAFDDLPEVGCEPPCDGRDFAGESSPCTGIAACECCQLATYPRHSDYERRTDVGARFVVPIVICPNCADSVRNRHVATAPMQSDLSSYLKAIESGAIPAPYAAAINYAPEFVKPERDLSNLPKKPVKLTPKLRRIVAAVAESQIRCTSRNVERHAENVACAADLKARNYGRGRRYAA